VTQIVCRSCFAVLDRWGIPVSPPADPATRILPWTTCKRCELQSGRVIESTAGLAFLSRKGGLYVATLDGAWMIRKVVTTGAGGVALIPWQ